MKKRRVFVTADELTDRGLVFSPENLRYLKRVLRLRPGDLVEAFDGVRSYGVRLILSQEKTLAGVIVDEERPAPARDREPELVIALGCIRPGPFREVLRHGTELGVTCFLPLITDRTARRPSDSKESWGKILASAASQCGAIRLPRIEQPMTLEQFLGRAKGQKTLLWLAARPEAEPLTAFLRKAEPEAVILVVGPEGGFDPREEAALMAAGLKPVSLNHRVLRAETAAIVAAGVVATWREELRYHERRSSVSASRSEPPNRGEDSGKGSAD